jgi:hypothetical protein
MNIQNSELQKCYWQSFSLQRIIAMPVVIFSIALLIILLDKEHTAQTLSGFAYQGFYLVVFLWGGYQAANALVQEVKENTWDNQRLSSVSPGELTVGKLFGSTLYTWYGGIILLIIYFFSACRVEDASTSIVIFNLFLLAGAGLFCHAIALLSSLIPLRMQASRDQFHIAGYFILGLITSGSFLSWGGALSFPYSYSHDDMTWFNHHVSMHDFFIGTLFVFLAWTIWAIYRFMREALQFKNTPAVWGLFVLFCMIYFAGLAKNDFSSWDNSQLVQQFLTNSSVSMAFFVAIACTYLNFFSESLNIIRYRTLFHHWQGNDWKKVSHSIPMWAVSFGLILPAGLFLVIASLEVIPFTQSMAVLVISSLLFLLRDACIFHYFTLNPNGRLPLLAALFYLGVFYLLIPNIIFAVGLKANEIGYIFYPTYHFLTDGTILMLLPVLIQVLIAGFLLKRRYRYINNLIDQ